MYLVFWLAMFPQAISQRSALLRFQVYGRRSGFSIAASTWRLIWIIIILLLIPITTYTTITTTTLIIIIMTISELKLTLKGRALLILLNLAWTWQDRTKRGGVRSTMNRCSRTKWSWGPVGDKPFVKRKISWHFEHLNYLRNTPLHT